MPHDITDLRRHLFETLEALRDKKDPMDIERAEAIAHVAQTIVNTGRLECDFLEILGGEGTGFCEDAPPGVDTSLSRLRLVTEQSSNRRR